MAITKIRGNTQILEGSVTNAELASGIELAKIQGNELLVKSDGSVAFTAPQTGVAPVSANHLATKAYVDSNSQGLDVKASVRAVATDEVTLSGLQTIDGVALVAGDRVLVTAQPGDLANGIYVVSAGGWTRSPDATTNNDVTGGLFTFVEEGNTGAGTGWVLTSVGETTLGTTPLPFAQFSSAGVVQAGDGLAQTGNVLSVKSASEVLTVSADGINLVLDGETLVAGPDGLKLADLAPGQMLVGSANGTPTARSISGDITIDAAGVARIAPGAVGAASIESGSLSLDKLVAGGAGQLILAGADGKPVYATISGDVAIDATGAVTIGAGVIGTAELADDSVTLDKLAPVTPGALIMGTADGNVAVTLSGDVTISETGVVSINAATVVRVQDMVNREIPVGLLNGVNDTFVLASAARAGTENVYVNGILQDPGAGNDYTIAGDTITMLYMLEATDKLRVSYYK